METRYYEGCGKVGAIRCIFLGVFHPVAGPKIACQFPEDYISKDTFDAISAYIIPKPQIQKCTMTINAYNHKIIGYPVRIENSRYERNAYLFNLCFVCDNWSKTAQYEPVVKKLGENLMIMEEETRFVSSDTSKLPTLLAHLLHDLNTHGKATLGEGDNVVHLKVLEIRKDPISVSDYDVPVIISTVGLHRPKPPQKLINQTEISLQPLELLHIKDEDPYIIDEDADWDLTTRQLLPFINGYNHVLKIAADSRVEKTLVKTCIQNLLYYEVVTLIPILKFSNMYRATPSIRQLFNDPRLQESCLTFISQGIEGKELKWSQVLQILAAVQQGTTLRTVCDKYMSGKDIKFDIRKLIIFSLVHGYLRCLKSYPVYVNNRRLNGMFHNEFTGVRKLFNGIYCTDEICIKAGIDLPTLEKMISEDPNVSIIWK